MAPKKKSNPSKKPNQINHSQPSKFGIQHFFERHSQSISTPRDPPDPPVSQLADSQSQKTPPKVFPEITADAGDTAQISPEFCNGMPLKRFRFSPRMLINQSQDDGGDEVTWKISPMNERLQAAAKHLPEMIRVLSDASKLNAPDLRICSEKKGSPCSVGKLERWLSSPTLKAPKRSIRSRRVSFQTVDPDKEKKVFHSSYECVTNLNSSGGTTNLQSPFRTPPSASYNSDESGDGFITKGASGQLGSRQHRKALLELLDQVEDVIAVEESLSKNSGSYLLVNQNELGCDKPLEDDPFEQTLACMRPKRVSYSHSAPHFLVLEVAEKHRTTDPSLAQNPIKVLRLLNEQSGEERSLRLCDDWFYSLVGPGDTVNVIGEFDGQGTCAVDHDNNLVIVHPDILVSGTRVAASFSCPRRTVLDERIKSNEHSVAALIGTLLHQIFQAGLIQEFPTRDFLEEYARTLLQKNIESLYAIGGNENDMQAVLIEAIPRILNWINCFRGLQEPKMPTVDFGTRDGQKAVSITEVIDIEEMAWSPKYGLKGMIDASLRVKLNLNNDEDEEKIIPLEFKTGKGTSGQSGVEHSAQVILYTLLLSDRYLQDIDSGLLYYLHTDQTRGIAVRRSDLVGLIMRRNAHAADVLKASTFQLLPPMLQSLNMCRGCRHLSACTIYHKAHGGNTESSGLGDLFDSHVEHLTIVHCDFFKRWDRLIDLEAKVSQVAKKEIWRPNGSKWDRSGEGLTSMILDVSNNFLLNKSSNDGRFVYRFVREESPFQNSELKNLDSLGATLGRPLKVNLDCKLKCGDYVLLRTVSGRIAIASGVIADINHSHVSISFSRRLRLPWSRSSSEINDLIQEVWLIDKDEVSSSFAIMRFNLIQLFVQSTQSSHLRQIIVDLEVPRFDSGLIFSQDPAISYIRSEKNLNDDQRRAIHKILTAKDYALILGMPGTGKTSTMVHAVKALLMRGASILLTSYTNSAVDNLLIKLKAQGIDFIRIGRAEAVHDEVRDYCFPGMKINNVIDVKLRMDQAKVVGVTCLGINHPLLTNKKFDICIMDEAGQITLPVSLGPLMLASKFVLVGDHYQLPPLVQSTEARENGMGVSLFCRLSEAHPQAISALQCQYRMCAGIMELSNALIYGNRLRCGSSEIANARLEVLSALSVPSWLKEVLDPNRSVVFINTDLLPALEAKEHKAVNNSVEAHIVSEITRVLLNGGVVGDEIGIITPYNSQANLIRSFVSTTQVEIHTIDKYQGRDKDCILLSFVRSLEKPRASTSSLLGDWHRINVAITRAKKKLIMVGSCGTLSRVPLLRLLTEKVDKQSGILNISSKDLHQFKEMKKCPQLSVQ